VSGEGRDQGSRRSPAQLAVLGVLAAFTFAAPMALGVWQVERRAWKLNLIAEVDARVHAAPVEAPGPASWPSIDAAHDAYLRVKAEGTFRNDRATLVQAVTSLGAGYWLMVPLHTDAGFTVLVNRGFVAQQQQNPSSRIATPTQVTGLLRLTEPHGGFLRSNDPAADHWYSRDVAAIGQARQLTDLAPYFIDADAAAGQSGDGQTGPVGGLTVISFPNNHLVYALTWFTLAAMVAFGAGYVARDEWRSRRTSPLTPPAAPPPG